MTKKIDSRIEKFAKAVESSVGSLAPTVCGENGSDMYTMYGLHGEGHPIIGGLVALFSGIVDNTSNEACSNFVKQAYEKISNANDISEEGRASFLADLIISAIQCRDIRNNGKGRRDQSRAMFLELITIFPETMLKILPELKEYGSWKDYNLLLERFANGQKYNDISLEKFVDAIYNLYIEQLKADRASYDEWQIQNEKGETTERCKISLAAKWLPKENRSLDRSTKCAKEIAKRMYPDLFKYDFKSALKKVRIFYAPLQDAIITTEKLECANRFDEIRFQFVPGKCLFKKKKAYLYEKKKGKDLRGSDPKRIQCRENLMNHLVKSVNGKATIHGKTVFIHELCNQVYTNWNNLTEGDKLVIEAQWLDHVNHFRKLMIEKGLAIDKGIVLADFSGSMLGDPMNGAMAIAILASTLSEGPFKDKFMSFESKPNWISLSYPNSKEDFDRMTHGTTNSIGHFFGSKKNPLGEWDSNRAGKELKFWEKVGVCYTSPWGGSTDFISAHDLILDICTKNKVSAPEWMIVVSDMQFDQAHRTSGNSYNTINRLLGISNLEEAQRKYVSNQNGVVYTYNSYSIKTEKWQDHHSILQQAYKAANVDFPTMIYWNMRSTKSFVTTADKPGVQMIGGFSTMQLKLFLEEMELDPDAKKPPTVTPWDTFRKAMDNECYEPIRIIIKECGEKQLSNYSIHTLKTTSDNDTEMQNTLETKITSDTDTEIQNTLETKITSDTDTEIQNTLETKITSDTDTEIQNSSINSSNVFNKLTELKHLLDNHLITQEDFDNKKTQILENL